jgi:hypothetical protein
MKRIIVAKSLPSSQLGYPMAEKIANGIWDWDLLWAQLDFQKGPR